jgi:CRISPR/Cas system CSM-associated protein Csm3 (group 7 of RAMP superfamily)
VTLPSITWSGTITATSSIAHAGESRGIIAMLRREQVIQPDSSTAQVPIISGNSVRGRLRRLAEEMLRDVLQYEGQLTISAAHALRAGGSLTKVGEPLSGSRLAQIRAHIPLIGVFGAAAGGRVIDGCLNVGKLVPLVTETDHVTGHTSSLAAFNIVQIENYTRLDDSTTHNFPITTDPSAGNDTQMLYQVETFRPGTTFTTQITLLRPTEMEAAFFNTILTEFLAHPRIGGHLAIGLGHAKANLTPNTAPPSMDWAKWLRSHRQQALEALAQL